MEFNEKGLLSRAETFRGDPHSMADTERVIEESQILTDAEYNPKAKG